MAVLDRWWGSLARRQGPDQYQRHGTWVVGQWEGGCSPRNPSSSSRRAPNKQLIAIAVSAC